MSVVFEVKEMALSSAGSLALADDHSLQHLFPELGLEVAKLLHSNNIEEHTKSCNFRLAKIFE